MTHCFKTLAVTYNRQGAKFTAYATGTGLDALVEVSTHPYFPGDDFVGLDSWDWLKSHLTAMQKINGLECMTKYSSGEWSLAVLCES